MAELANLFDGLWWTGLVWPVLHNTIYIILIIVPILVGVAYLTLAERKVIGWMQLRRNKTRRYFN
ncbi:MAG: hypothetical protein AAF352_06030 [Pseudomonadota bacterium]